MRTKRLCSVLQKPNASPCSTRASSRIREPSHDTASRIRDHTLCDPATRLIPRQHGSQQGSNPRHRESYQGSHSLRSCREANPATHRVASGIILHHHRQTAEQSKAAPIFMLSHDTASRCGDRPVTPRVASGTIQRHHLQTAEQSETAPVILQTHDTASRFRDRPAAPRVASGTTLQRAP